MKTSRKLCWTRFCCSVAFTYINPFKYRTCCDLVMLDPQCVTVTESPSRSLEVRLETELMRFLLQQLELLLLQVSVMYLQHLRKDAASASSGNELRLIHVGLSQDCGLQSSACSTFMVQIFLEPSEWWIYGSRPPRAKIVWFLMKLKTPDPPAPGTTTTAVVVEATGTNDNNTEMTQWSVVQKPRQSHTRDTLLRLLCFLIQTLVRVKQQLLSLYHRVH